MKDLSKANNIVKNAVDLFQSINIFYRNVP